jgi:hypothetical protein
MSKNAALKAMGALSLVVVLGACTATTPLGPREPLRPNEMLAGTPLPPGSTIANDKSLLIGGTGHWVGRLVLNLSGSTQDAFAFFEEQMPAQGWTVISSVRGEQSLMVLTKQDLTATVAFTERSGFGAGTATLTVTPRNSAIQNSSGSSLPSIRR